MTLVPHKISHACHRTARLSGFDIDHPQQRHPVQNALVDRLLRERGRLHDPRANILLKGRQALTRFIKREK
jgi:hypothetical protein